MIHVRNYVVEGIEYSPVMVNVMKFLLRLSQQGFHGDVNLQFSDGQVTLITKEERIKPGNLNFLE